MLGVFLLVLVQLQSVDAYVPASIAYRNPSHSRHFASTPSDVNTLLLNQNKLLVDIWKLIAFPDENASGEFRLSDYGLTRKDMPGFIQHFQSCKDCAADRAFLMATQNDDNEDMMKLSSVYFPVLVEGEDDEEWGTFDKSLLGDEQGVSGTSELSIFPIEDDDAVVLKDSKRWVKKVIADFGICPFTMDPERAGVPQGGVRYSVSRATNIDEAFYCYWDEIYRLLSASEKEIATTLLVFPEVGLFGDYELFEAYCDCLSDALSCASMGFEKEIQLVFFHPKYQFRDGQARSGDDMGAANFARRTPWPMINLLRSKQVKNAQKGVPTGVVYKQNEERLIDVGVPTLSRMLYDRNWDNLPTHSSVKLLKKLLETTGISVEAAPVDKCPIDHSTAASIPASSISPLPTQAPLKCPIDHGIASATVHEKPTEPVLKEVADYERLADDIEKWLRESA